ncbi:MAG: hypothetical protein AAF490_06205 [Chloroflexota bacterium]
MMMKWFRCILCLGLFLSVACLASEPEEMVSITPPLLPTATSMPTVEPSLMLPPTATQTAVSPTPILTHTPLPTATNTVTPTATAVPFQPEFINWESPEDLPGLISRSGGGIAGIAGNDEVIWALIGRELVGIDMLAEGGPQVVGTLVVPFYTRTLYAHNQFIIAVTDQIFVIDVSDPTAPKGEYSISGLGEFTLRQNEAGALFVKDSAGEWWRFLPQEHPELRFLLAEEFPQPASTQALERWLGTAVPNPMFIEQLGDSQNRLFVIDWIGDPILIENTVYFALPTLTSALLIAADGTDRENLQLISVYESFNTTLQAYQSGALITGIGGGDGPAQGYSLIDVQSLETPRLLGNLPIGSQPFVLDGRYLYMGRHPGVSKFDWLTAPNLAPIETVSSPRSENTIANQRMVVKHPNRDLLLLVNGTHAGEEKNIELVETDPTLNFVGQIRTNQILAVAAYNDVVYVLEPEQLRLFDIQNRAEAVEIGAYPFIQAGQPPVKVLSMTSIIEDTNGRLSLPILTNQMVLLLDVTEPDALTERGQYLLPNECQTSAPWSIQQIEFTLYLRFPQCPIQQIDLTHPEAPILLNELPISAPFLIADGVLFAQNLGRLEIYDLQILLNKQ